MSQAKDNLEADLKNVLQKMKVNNNDDYNLAFRKAASVGDLISLQTLYKSGKVSVNAVGSESKCSALHNLLKLAKKLDGLKECLIFLLSVGANPLLKDSEGKSPMDYWVPRKQHIPRKLSGFSDFVDDVLEMGRLIQGKQEELDAYLEKQEQEELELILNGDDHLVATTIDFLETRIDLLKEDAFLTMGIEQPYHAKEIDLQIQSLKESYDTATKLLQDTKAMEPSLISQHKEITLLQASNTIPENEPIIQESLAQLTDGIQKTKQLLHDLPPRINDCELRLKEFEFLKKNAMEVFYIDPRLLESKTPYKELYKGFSLFPLRDQGMAVAMALELVKNKKVIGMCGIKHMKGICERLYKMLPKLKIHTFFIHQENYATLIEPQAIAHLQLLLKEFPQIIPIQINKSEMKSKLTEFDKNPVEKIIMEKTGLGDKTQIVMGYLFESHTSNILNDHQQAVNSSKPSEPLGLIIKRR